jgi:apolipoprotein N-acyltransferase
MMRSALRPTLAFCAIFLLFGFGAAWLRGEHGSTNVWINLLLTALFASLVFGAACASLMRQQSRTADLQGRDELQ